MKRAIYSILFIAAIGYGHAQTKIEKTFQIKPGQALTFDFDHPQVVLQTWDKNEVLVKGTVSINMGENDNAFELLSSVAGDALNIESIIKDKEKIPHRIVIKKDDQEYYFKAHDLNDPEIQKFLDDHGRDYTYISDGVQMDIHLEVFVPKNTKTTVNAKYGLVEFKKFEAPLRIDAKYGKVDATIISATTGQLVARSRYGEILSNLDIKFDQEPFAVRGKGNRDQWTELKASPGKGFEYFIESKYGTVYLRKPI